MSDRAGEIEKGKIVIWRRPNKDSNELNRWAGSGLFDWIFVSQNLQFIRGKYLREVNSRMFGMFDRFGMVVQEYYAVVSLLSMKSH